MSKSVRITDVLAKCDLMELCEGDIQYSTLVTLYRKISKEKIDFIASAQTSFMDVLTESSSSQSWDSLDSSNKLNHEALCRRMKKIIEDKITVGLMAIDKILIEEVTSTILHMDSNFASTDFIESLCESKQESFSIKMTTRGKVLSKVIAGKPNVSESEPEKNSPETRIQKQLKHLMKNRPDVIRAMETNLSWKSLLKAYAFWQEFCSFDLSSTYVDWLLSMAKAKSPNESYSYKKNLQSLLLRRIVEFVGNTTRTVSDIVGNLCVDRPRFVNESLVHEIIVFNPVEVAVLENSQTLSLGQQPVTLTTRKLDRHVDNIALLGPMESRVTPLLSTRVTFTNIASVYKILLTKTKVKECVMKHGCFLRYLVEYGKARKPKLSSTDYHDHLQSLIKNNMTKVLKDYAPEAKTAQEVMEKIAGVEGLLDLKFINDTATNCYHIFTLDESGRIALRDSATEDADATEILQSPEICQLLYERPKFRKVMEKFVSLSKEAKSMLANNSMSFFEWLITIAKQRDAQLYPMVESHLHSIVREEVMNIHTKNHCQMTIHHVHIQICQGNPMLLSPNFLNWCLNRPESPFYVYESWVYLKNAAASSNRYAMDIVSQAHSSFHLQQNIGTHVLQLIKNRPNLPAILSIVKEISSEQTRYILQSSSYWFDFFESNMKSRRERLELAFIVVADAKTCLGYKILDLSELILLISRGVSNFISRDVLIDILQQRRDCFALSNSIGDNAMVGLVRETKDNDIVYFDQQEQDFSKKILLCFPASGSCKISVYSRIAQQEMDMEELPSRSVDLSVNFLKCYFLMYPMLFYVQDDSVVLTCTALERKKHNELALQPTSTTDLHNHQQERPKKRSRSHKRSKRSKKRRRSKDRRESLICNERMSNSQDPEIDSSTDLKIDVSSDESSDEHLTIDESLLDESKNEGEDTNSARQNIEELPEQLIVDVAANILLCNNHSVEPNVLLKELMSSVLGTEDIQEIAKCDKYMNLFKDKVFKVLRGRESKFVLVCDVDSLDSFDVVKLVKGKQSDPKPLHPWGTDAAKNSPEHECQGDQAVQQVEISSTSATPEKQESVAGDYEDTSHNHDPNENSATFEDVIKLSESPNSPSCSNQSTLCDDERDSEVTKKQCFPRAPISIPVVSPDPVSKTNGKSIFNVKHVPKGSREYQLDKFCREFLHVNGGTCTVDIVLERCYRYFERERFARSRLAFEAYLFDFLLRNPETYRLSGYGSQFGVTWITSNEKGQMSLPHCKGDNLLFLRLLPEICIGCFAYLEKQTDTLGSLDDMCQMIESNLRNQLNMYSEREIAPVIRCSVLVALIRNLRLFCFAVDSPVVYLRNQRPKLTGKFPSQTASCSTSHKHSNEIDAILQNPLLTEAILLMAHILQSIGQSSVTALRNIWQARAPSKLANLFGTGISFTLSLRKYSFLFSSNDDGLITVDQDTLSYMRSRV